MDAPRHPTLPGAKPHAETSTRKRSPMLPPVAPRAESRLADSDTSGHGPRDGSLRAGGAGPSGVPAAKGGVGTAAGKPSVASSSQIQWMLCCSWIVACIKMMVDSVNAMKPERRSLFIYEAYLYYNPLFMVATMTWLWGVNLFGLAHSRVSYARVFELDHNHLTHWDIWKVALWLTTAVLTSMASYLYFFSHGLKHLAAAQPVLVYCSLPLVLALPFDFLYGPSRFYFLNTLFRLAFPFQPISFADFFLADILTSLSKVLSDLERAVCRMANGQVASLAWMDADDVCGSHSLMIPWVLVLPYGFRFCQCIRQYTDTKDKSCLFNALKYSTAFPVVVLSAAKYHVPLEHWSSFYRPLWVACAVANSAYSFFWDVSKDWDFGCLAGSCSGRNKGLLLRPNLYFPYTWVYYFVIFSNLILRGTWTYKLSAHLRHNYTLVFIMSFLEMYRRFQWVFFRVENEWNKITTRSSLSGSTNSLRDLEQGKPSESQPLLASLATHVGAHGG